MSSSLFIMDAPRLENFVHTFLHGRFWVNKQKYSAFYRSCLLTFSWVLLYLDWLFRTFPTLHQILSITLFFIQFIVLLTREILIGIYSIFYQFMVYLLLDVFRLRKRKNYRRLKRIILFPKRFIMGSILSEHRQMNDVSKDLCKVELVPTHVYTKKWHGADVFENPQSHEIGIDSECNCCPRARSGHRALVDLNYVYIVGGYNARIDGTRTMSEVWRLNTITNAWSQVTIDGLFPQSMASFVAISRDYTMRHSLIFGGTGYPFGLSATDKLYSLKERKDGMFHIGEEMTNGDRPPALYGSALVAADSKTFYLIGGTTGHEYNLDIWRLCLNIESNTWTWTQLTRYRYDSPAGRYRHEAVFMNEKIIIFGGGTPSWSEQLEKLIAFDVNTNNFIEVLTEPDPQHGYPIARKCHATVKYGNEVYIIGGCHETAPVEEFVLPNTYTILNDIWKIDLESMRWSKLNTNLINGVFFHSAVVTFEGCIYVFGGCCDGRSTIRTNRVQRLWIRPPSLQRLAMQAIIHCMPELVPQYKEKIRISRVNEVIRDFHTYLNSNAG